MSYNKNRHVERGGASQNYSQESNKNHPNINAINRAALDALQVVLSRWFQDERMGCKRIEWNPQQNINAGAFSINLITGHWTNFITGDCGSNIISLASYLSKIDQEEASRRLAAMLGMGDHHA